MIIFVKNSHLLAKLRTVLKEPIHLTSSEHEEATLGACKKQENMLKRRVAKLGELLDPFSPGPVKHMKSGVLLDVSIIKCLLQFDEIGEKHLQRFILKRIKVNENAAISFLHQLKPELEVNV